MDIIVQIDEEFSRHWKSVTDMSKPLPLRNEFKFLLCFQAYYCGWADPWTFKPSPEHMQWVLQWCMDNFKEGLAGKSPSHETFNKFADDFILAFGEQTF